MGHERRIFEHLPPANRQEGSVIPLSPDNSRHLIQVLRLSEGATIVCVDRESGEAFTALLIDCGKPAFVKLIEKHTSSSLTPSFILSFGVLKGDKTEFVLEKACELGATHLNVVLCDHSIPRFKSVSDQEKKILRYNKIIETASKQSGRTLLPSFHLYCSVAECLSASPSDGHHLFCTLGVESIPVKSLYPIKGEVHLFIGPEGDFSQREIEEALSSQWKMTSLGNLRLRSETAAIAGLAMVSALREDAL